MQSLAMHCRLNGGQETVSSQPATVSRPHFKQDGMASNYMAMAVLSKSATGSDSGMVCMLMNTCYISVHKDVVGKLLHVKLNIISSQLAEI